MSTNSNLQQINVFTKGMNTDTSDAFLSNELYRYAENLRFVAEEGGGGTSTGGEMCIIEGWKQKVVGGLSGIEIIGVSSIRNYIIVVGKKNDGWYVWTIYTATKDDKWDLVRSFGPCKDEISHASIVTRWESDNNIKVYIADGVHQLLSLNIARDGEGNLLHEYGTEIKDISSRLEITLPQLQTSVNNNQESRIPAPVLQYAYILYQLGGATTDISPLSKPVVLYKTQGGYYVGETVTSTVTLTLDNIDATKVDRIKVYRIGYVQNGQDPDIALIYDDVLLNSTEHQFEFIDNGYNILNITAAEFIALNNINFKPLLIESKNDYLFAANIEYDQQEVDKTFEECQVEYTVEIGDEYSFDIYNKINDLKKYKPSFKRGETYRFGIVFYDSKGRKSSVMQISDVDIPGKGDEDYIESFSILLDNGTYKAHPYKIKAHITNIPKDCSGYELVRCKRSIHDTKCITQGIIGRTQLIDDVDLEKGNRLAFSYMTMDKFYNVSVTNNGKNFKSSTDLIMFASPEYMYLADDVKSIINNYKNTLKLNSIDKYSIPVFLPNRIYYCGADSAHNFATLSSTHNYGNSVTSNCYVLGDKSPLNTLTASTNLYAGNTNLEFGVSTWYDSSNQRYNICYTSYPIDSDSKRIHNVLELDINKNIDKSIYISKLYPVEVFNGTSTKLYIIDDINYTDTPDPFGFNKGTDNQISIDNDKTSLKGLSFINWDAISCYDRTGLYEDGTNGLELSDIGITSPYWSGYAVTAGKKCILIKTNILESPIVRPDPDEPSASDSIFTITTAEIINTNVSPYGGSNDAAKNNSVFYSFGDYKKREDSVLQDDVYTSNGDSFICSFVYNSAHCWESGIYKSLMYPTVYIVPVESSIDLRATYGNLYTNMTSLYKYWFQDKAGQVGKLVQEKDAYLYNTTYNGTRDLISYTPMVYTSISNDKFDCRVHYSDIKTNGEQTDSWLNFKAANFIDVDTRYGQITDLNLFKDILVFWLDNATGILAVNERTMLQDVNDTNIILGNGDVLLRYDYLTTEYGMESYKNSRTLSNNALYWWDGHKKEILLYPGGREVLPLKKVKTISRYINSIAERERLCLAYDSNYAEILIHLGETNDSSLDYDGRDMTLVYNEYIQQFTGVYETPFDFSVKLPDRLFLIRNNIFYKWNESESGSLKPVLKYVVNKDNMYVKVFDNIEFGMGEKFLYSTFYTQDSEKYNDSQCYLKFDFDTQGQHSEKLKYITSREYDLRMSIPRDGDNVTSGNTALYGNRMRGRTMLCTVSNTNIGTNFSLLYIITKYRISNS